MIVVRSSDDRLRRIERIVALRGSAPDAKLLDAIEAVLGSRPLSDEEIGRMRGTYPISEVEFRRMLEKGDRVAAEIGAEVDRAAEETLEGVSKGRR